MDYSTFLSRFGYTRLSSRAEHVLSYAATEALNAVFDSPAASALLSHMSTTIGLREADLLTNYQLLESELSRAIGQGADIILRRVVEYIRHSPEVDIKTPTFTIPELLREIRTQEVKEFLRKVGGNNHILVVYENDSFKDVVIRSFLDPEKDPTAPKGLFSADPTGLRGVRNMLSAELSHRDRLGSITKLSSWMSYLYSSNQSQAPTRIVRECNWFLENYWISEILEHEKSIGPYPQPNMTLLCSYSLSNTSKLREYQAKTVTESHNHAVIEYQSDVGVYQRGLS